MEKQVIGNKIQIHLAIAILMIAVGLAMIVGLIYMFLFILGGAIGGGIAGAGGVTAGMIITLAIMSQTLPNDLILIDDTYLYLNRQQIRLDEIEKVSVSRTTLVIKPVNAKRINQMLVKHVSNVANKITEIIQTEHPESKNDAIVESNEN